MAGTLAAPRGVAGIGKRLCVKQRIAAANHGLAIQLIRRADSRAEVAPVGIVDTARLAVHPGKKQPAFHVQSGSVQRTGGGGVEPAVQCVETVS